MSEAFTCRACGHAIPAGMILCPRDGTPIDEPTEIKGTPNLADATVLRDPMLGRRIGEYQVESRCGEGGMGVVYRGTHPIIGKAVAIKVLQGDIAHNPEQIKRLIAEARAVNAIRHRGIVDIFGFGQLEDGRQYLVMELLDGTPLDQAIAAESPMAPVAALHILEEVMAALQAAHRVGVIHRDLKPSNVFVVQPPVGARYVKLLDFGLAKQAPVAGGTTPQTRASMMVGTPYYIAPEQARGAEVGPATDIYSLGVMAFEMLTGKLPYQADSPLEVVFKHLKDEVPRVSSRVPEVPPKLDELVFRTMQKDPAARPDDATVLAELSELRVSLVRDRPTVSAPAVPAAPSRAASSLSIPASGSKKAAVVVLAALAALAIVVPTAIWATRSSSGERQPELAVAPPVAVRPPVEDAPKTEAPPAPVKVEEPEPARLEAPVPPPTPVKAVVKEPTRPRDPIATVRLRLRRVQAAWARERSRRSPEDVRIFDLTLAQIARQAGSARPEDNVELRRALDEFVGTALRGQEP